MWDPGTSYLASCNILFEISADRSQLQQKLQLTKIVPLERPTSMAFGPAGTLYLTVLGQAAAEGAKPAGKLLRIAAGL